MTNNQFKEITNIIDNLETKGLFKQADSLNNILDSLVKGKQDELVIAASSVDITGKVIGSPTFKRSDLIVSKEVVPKLEKVRKLIVQARNSSTNNGLIKIYDYYNLDIQLGIKVKLKL